MDKAASAIDDRAFRTSFLEDGVTRFLMRRHRWPQCQLFVAIATSTFASIVVIQATRQIVDNAIPTKSVALLAEIGAGAFVAVIVKLAANYAVRILSTYIENLFTADVRDLLAAQAMSLRDPTLLRGPSGDIHDRIITGVAHFVIGIEAILVKPLIATTSLIVYGAYLISIDVSLMYTLLTLAPALVASPWLNRRLSANRRARVLSQERYAGQLQETLDAVDEIQAHGTRNIERGRLREDHTAMTRSFMGETMDLALYDLLSVGAADVSFMAVYVFGGYYAVKGELSLGILIAFVTAARSFCGAFTDLLGYPPVYRNVADRFEELKTVMRLRAADPGEAQDGVSDTLRSSPLVYDVVKASVVVPPNRITLNEASLRIAPGEHVALVGRSGCGKSTLLNLLAGRIPAAAGAVALGGVALNAWPRPARVAAIGYVRQVPFVFLGTLRDNLLYRARGLADAGAPLVLDDASLIEACEWAGLHHDMLDMALEMRGTQTPTWGSEVADLRARFKDVEEWIDPDRYIPAVSVLENVTYRPWDSEATPLQAHHVRDLAAKIRACDPILFDGLTALGRAIAQRQFDLMRADDGADHDGFGGVAMADRALVRDVINGTGARQIAASMRLALSTAEPIEQDLQRRSVAARRALKGAVSFPPNPPFDARWSTRLTVLENMTGVRLAADQDHLRDRLKARLVAVFDDHPRWRERLIAMALDCELAEEGLNLSGGQREKIALARVLVTRPPILLLDEISASLDPASAERVQRTLRDHFGATSIVAVMHDLDAARWYDRVVVIGDGHVIEDLPLGVDPISTITHVRRQLDQYDQIMPIVSATDRSG